MSLQQAIFHKAHARDILQSMLDGGGPTTMPVALYIAVSMSS